MGNSDFLADLEEFKGEYLDKNLQLKLASMKLQFDQMQQEVQGIKSLSSYNLQTKKRTLKVKLRNLHCYFESLQEEARELQEAIDDGFTRIDTLDECLSQEEPGN
ncbi:MAG: hypothetical protein R6U67_00110 [Sodalinema sp.]|uniref:hypothetical protein n=1 Tax=Sodalinema sp. TaxID=3080550 RepID=UPI0011FC4318|nr:MAG: hypothetical protein EYR95_10985 [Phormidium sp. SL48-SHIP]